VQYKIDQGIKPGSEVLVLANIALYILDYMLFASANAKEFNISYSKIDPEGVP